MKAICVRGTINQIKVYVAQHDPQEGKRNSFTLPATSFKREADRRKCEPNPQVVFSHMWIYI